MSLKWVCVSGYFDPLHIGHIEKLLNCGTVRQDAEHDLLKL